MKMSAIVTAATASAAVLVGASSFPAAPAQAQASIKSVPLPAPTTASAPPAPTPDSLAWVQKHVAGWPEKTRRVAALLVTEYGAPAEVTAHHLTWYDNGPWKRTTLYKAEVQHNFAKPHEDILEQTISYRVPRDKLAALAEFDGSLVVNRTRGELSSASDSEDTNFLALNVADDLIRGERDADRARAYYAQIIRARMIKEPESYLQALKFKPATDTADPDEIAPLIRHMSGADE
jgi:hypothetical protein